MKKSRHKTVIGASQSVTSHINRHKEYIDRLRLLRSMRKERDESFISDVGNRLLTPEE